MYKCNMYSNIYMFEKTNKKSNQIKNQIHKLINESHFEEMGLLWAALFRNKHDSQYEAFVTACIVCIVCHLILVPGCDVKSLGQNSQCSLVSKTSIH